MNSALRISCDIPPDELIPLVDDLAQRRDELAEFVSLRQTRRRLEAQGIAELLAACDKLGVESDRLPEVFAAIVTERKAASARRAEACVRRTDSPRSQSQGLPRARQREDREDPQGDPREAPGPTPPNRLQLRTEKDLDGDAAAAERVSEAKAVHSGAPSSSPGRGGRSRP